MGGRNLGVRLYSSGAILTADMDHVFKTGRGDQRGSRAFALQQRVGCDR